MPATSKLADVENVPPVEVVRLQVVFPPIPESSRPAPLALLRTVTVAPMPQPPPDPVPENPLALKISTSPMQVTPVAVQAGSVSARTTLECVGKAALAPTMKNTIATKDTKETKDPSQILI